MKLSLNWLKNYVSLSQSPEEIAHALTMCGFEVEAITRTGLPPLSNVVVGEVLTRDKHPNADKLSVCTVSVSPSQPPAQIVCGAQNYKVGDRVPVALVGAVLPGHFKIKQSKIRSVESFGMMCSAKELGLGDDHGGLLILESRPEIGTPINAALPGGDVVLDVELTPNRPDCLSHIGLARELAAYFRTELTYPEIHTQPASTSEAAAPQFLESVTVTAPEDCPHYTAQIITGVQIAPSPAWLQDALKSIGLRPINNVVDATNYVLHEFGQPLHAFDAKKISGHRLNIRHASEGEKLTTLDGKERTLTSKMLVIADAEKPLVIAGIMGGASAEVDSTTTDVVLEAAYFRPQSIRATSKRLTLSSDSSYRFERGVDPHGVLEAASRCIDLILKTAGGKVVGPLHKVGSEPPTLDEISFAPDFIRHRAGYEISDAEMREIFSRIEIEIAERDVMGLNEWTAKIPSWRGDLERPIDLVEEIVRMYGCEKIPATSVQAVASPEADDSAAEFVRAAATFLVGQHFNECVNYTLRSGPETTRWTSPEAAAALALANPFTDDQSHLRPSLINGLLDNLRLNQDRRTGATRLFETGRTFRVHGDAVLECVAIAFVIRTKSPEAQWLQRSAPDFFTAKNLLQTIATHAGIDLAKSPAEPVTAAHAGWQSGHAASFGKISDGFEARCGLLSLAQTRTLDIDGPVLAGILHVLPEKLAEHRTRNRYQNFSLFPAALRDIALVADASVPAETVRRDLAKAARATATAGFAVEDVRIFDVYTGTGLPEGKRSLAFSLSYRSAERTLTDDEVNAAFTKLQESLAAAGSYSIRK